VGVFGPNDRPKGLGGQDGFRATLLFKQKMASAH
jgi:hypothetical protein